ncbi:NAD(P)H-binding protein [Pseudaestuariivita sp.]|uniref:NAD(P)H-binding protein n=1 Tax=Pseudaestuariivita sp. TaxID=2211669 RepID=UPI0040582839
MHEAQAQRVALFGATGTIGRATLSALIDAGHEVLVLGRSVPEGVPAGVEVRAVDVTSAEALLRALRPEDRYTAALSCLASRTGAPKDAWAIDHAAHLNILAAAEAAGIRHFVLLSALCVQKPRLAFQHAKLAFEAALQASPLSHSIVRPTAYFKSLSGQLARVQAGKPFLLFGDGTLTACKPISDRDLGRYLALTVTEPEMRNKVLPIGGPGPAMTARALGEALFAATGQSPQFRHVPVGMMRAIVGGLSVAGLVSAKAADKAELARIGRYYATESMLVWDAVLGEYDADATPEFGTDRIEEHYARLVLGEVSADLGDHAVF